MHTFAAKAVMRSFAVQGGLSARERFVGFAVVPSIKNQI
jgi:hypothetical protein